MAIYTIGEVVKRERLAQGITQEALSENICSVSWLSKIESGMKTPTPQVFELLMTRLGKNMSQYILFKNEREMEIRQLKQEIDACYRTEKNMKGREVLKKFVEIRDQNNPVDLQYELLYKTLFYEGELSVEKEEERLTEALALTCKDFDEHQMMNYLFSSEEIAIINHLGGVYLKQKKVHKAMDLFKALLSYLERPKFDIEEKKRIYSVVAFNLSTLTEMMGNFEEGIYYADKGIEFAVEYNILRVLPKLLYSKGSCLLNLGQMEEGTTYLTKAYHIFNAIKKQESAETLKERAKKEWGVNIT